MSTKTKQRLKKKLDKNPSAITETANYTLTTGDIDKDIITNAAGANTLTVPPNATVPIPVGSRHRIFQKGAGQTTIAPGAGVTINSAGGKLKTTGQYSVAWLEKTGTDEWLFYGDIAV